MIGCGRSVFAVADRSKLGRQAVVKVGHVSQLTRLYTDGPLSAVWPSVFAEHGVEVMHPAQKTV